MDLSKARWRFESVSDEYGVRIQLVDPADLRPGDHPASAVIGSDWPAERIALTLTALEDVYVGLPEPTPENT